MKKLLILLNPKNAGSSTRKSGANGRQTGAKQSNGRKPEKLHNCPFQFCTIYTNRDFAAQSRPIARI